MAWTATKTAKGLTDGSVFVQATYTDGTTTFVESYKTTAVGTDWPDGIIRNRLSQLNGINLATVPLGAVLAAPTPTGKTPAEVALDSWLVLRDTYVQTKARLAFGDGKTNQASVDSALAAVKSNYIDAYAPYLKGVF